MKKLAMLTLLTLACGKKDDDLGITVGAARTAPCPANPAFDCSDSVYWPRAAVDKMGDKCSIVDATGCLRRSCRADTDCLAGETCYEPGCLGSGWDCSNAVSEAGVNICQCTETLDFGGRYCRAK